MSLEPVRSIFAPTVVVNIDQWGVNPLLEDAQQAVPAAVALATQQNGEPPTMFDSGDLPPFTASGVDPRFLALLPWRIRHAAAMAPNAVVVLGWVEQYGHDDTVEMRSPGLDEYVGRFRMWLRGQWTNPNHRGADAAAVETAAGDLYDSMFGDQERLTAAANASKRAAEADFVAMRNRTGKYADGTGRAQR
ncbi:MAG: hypothetical protein JWO98_319 [Frankiales bacterium]|nr:hypothetical protein [Frankiales bacterium]